jgi:4-amino-4-deoxychorismate lyase
MLIETIRVVDGHFVDVERHLRRMKESSAEVYGHPVCLPDLSSSVIPAEMRRGIVKCRIEYGRGVSDISFTSYVPRDIRTLKLIDSPPGCDYHLKYADRGWIGELAAMRGDCDDILIIKDGLPTDTSYTNIMLQAGETFHTPDSCLLPGTMRARLIECGMAKIRHIALSDLFSSDSPYTHIRLINAMMPLEEAPSVPISSLK